MRKKCFVFLIFAMFSAITFANGMGPQKYYLSVFIGKYENNAQGKSWSSLSSSNDRTIVLEMLKNQGFNTDKSIVLSDQEATKSNLWAAIEKLTDVSANV